MTSPSALPRRAVAVVASHGLAAIGMGLPWPVLLVAVEQTTHSEALLGGVGALRLAPYVALSWLSGRLADRRERARIVRLSLWARIVLLGGAAVALAGGSWPLATLLCTGAIVAGTPAFPALAAGMPRLAGPATERATALLVTTEVVSFVIGPALGGLLIGRLDPAWVVLVGAGLVTLAVPCFGRTLLPAPARHGPVAATGVLRLLAGNRAARQALLVVAAINAVLGALGLALLPLAEDVWGSGISGFGLATAVLGFGSLAAPLLARAPVLRGARGGLLALGALVAGGVLLPWAAPALTAIGLVGAVAVCCESAATRMLQEAVPDALRASVLGLGDSVMVAAALLATASAPTLAAGLGPVLFGVAVAGGSVVLGLVLAPPCRVSPLDGGPAGAATAIREVTDTWRLPTTSKHPHDGAAGRRS